MRISDWSSDVCSSDLYCGIRPAPCFGGAAIDMIAGKEGQFLGALRPDLRHPGRRDIATADREARLTDPGVVGDDRQVGEAGQLRGDPKAQAVNGDDDRLRVPPYRLPAVEIAAPPRAILGSRSAAALFPQLDPGDRNRLVFGKKV